MKNSASSKVIIFILDILPSLVQYYQIRMLRIRHNTSDKPKEFLPLDWLYSACLPVPPSGFPALVEVDFYPLPGLVSPFYIAPPIP